MKILISQGNAGDWQKKGVLGFRFEEKGRDRMIIEQDGKYTLTLVIGEKEKMTQRKLILLARRVVYEAIQKKFKTIIIDFQDFRRIASNCTFLAIARKVQQFSSAKISWEMPEEISGSEQISDGEQLSDGKLAELLAVNFLMASFVFRDFLEKPKEGFLEVEKVILVNAGGKEIKQGIERGIIIGEEVNRSRHIATMPGSDMTPFLLAEHTKKVVKGLPIKFSVLDKKQMARLKMGGVLGVGKGSQEKPKFIILEYFGTHKKDNPIVLVGKGVTFDTGGINLKPSDAILGMNMDMSGGAAVIHALVAGAPVRLLVKLLEKF